MTLRAKLCLCLLLMTFAAVGITAADKYKSKPKSNEVVIVTRFLITPEIDNDFFSNYIAFEVPGMVAKRDKSLKGELPKHSIHIQTNKVNRSMMYAEMEYGGSLGGFCFLKLTIPKDRQIQIDGARLYVFTNSFLYVDLPLFRKVSVPEDVHYIYLGSLQYDFAGNFFEIKSISKLDEFDIAAVELAKQYGPDARLYRANLSQIEEPAKK